MPSHTHTLAQISNFIINRIALLVAEYFHFLIAPFVGVSWAYQCQWESETNVWLVFLLFLLHDQINRNIHTHKLPLSFWGETSSIFILRIFCYHEIIFHNKRETWNVRFMFSKVSDFWSISQGRKSKRSKKENSLKKSDFVQFSFFSIEKFQLDDFLKIKKNYILKASYLSYLLSIFFLFPWKSTLVEEQAERIFLHCCFVSSFSIELARSHSDLVLCTKKMFFCLKVLKPSSGKQI